MRGCLRVLAGVGVRKGGREEGRALLSCARVKCEEG